MTTINNIIEDYKLALQDLKNYHTHANHSNVRIFKYTINLPENYDICDNKQQHVCIFRHLPDISDTIKSHIVCYHISEVNVDNETRKWIDVKYKIDDYKIKIHITFKIYKNSDEPIKTIIERKNNYPVY